VTAIETGCAREPLMPPLIPPANAGRPPAKSLLFKTGWSGLACASTVMGRFLITIITARRLGPDGAGKLAYLLWLVEIVATLTGFGTQSCITRFVADLHGQGRADLAPSLARWLYIRYLALTSLGAVVIAAVVCRQQPPDPAVWIWLSVWFVLQALGTFYLSYLGGQQRFDLIARVNLISTFVFVLGAGLGTLLAGVTGTLAGYAAGSAWPALLSCQLLRGGRAKIDLNSELKSRCLRYALFAWLAAVVSACVWSRVEIVFLERYSGRQAVAMFSIGLTLSAVAVQGPLLLGGALMPHFAESASAGDTAAGRRIYSSATRLLAALLFPLCLGLSSVVPVLLPAVYGGAFRAAVPGAMVLTAFSALAFMNVGSALVYASEKAWFVAVSGLAGAALSLVGCVLVVPVWGAWGASLSRSVVQIAMVVLGAWYIGRHLACPAPLRALAKILFASAAAALCSYFTISYAHHVLALVVAVPVASCVYLMLLRMTRPLEADDVQSIANALDRMPRTVSLPLSGLIGWIAL
jgi:O-antigen/teichoic acid export membrane protein